MQIMSFWNTWIMIINMKIIVHLNAINVHLKYMNYDHKHENNISLIKIQIQYFWNTRITIINMKLIFN